MARKGKVTGGQNLNRILIAAKYGGVRNVTVGFFEGARYDDRSGTAVAKVAARNEFGIGVPERPFIRPANLKAVREIKRILWESVDPQTMRVTQAIAGDVGNAMKTAYQKSIIELRSPPNAPATVARKRKRRTNSRFDAANPLIDTTTMLNSVGYEVKY